MSKNSLQLHIVTQERELVRAESTSITVMTTEGEITVLPGHIPLFAKLASGELIYRSGDAEESYAVTGGFLDVSPEGEVTVLADHAIRADDINEAMAEEARRNAEEALKNKESKRDFMLAEASLRQALNELTIATKRKRTSRF